MRLPTNSLAFAAGLCGLLSAAPASTQSAPAQAGQQRTVKLSKEAQKPILALQSAVDAKNSAAVPALAAAAQAAARTPEDKMVIASLQLRAAAAANDEPAMAAAIDALLATGAADQQQVGKLTFALAKIHYRAKQFDRAAPALERVLASEPANVEAMTLLVETRAGLGRNAEAAALLNTAIATEAAAGRKPPEQWYKRAAALALKSKLPGTVEAARQWLAAYPSKTSWRDAIRIHIQESKLDGQAALDALRLARAAGALEGERDYGTYLYEAAEGGTPGEAKAVLLEGAAAKAIDPAKPPINAMEREIRMRAAGESVNLKERTAAALAGPAAKPLVAAADSHFGRGDYAEAAKLYRAALGKAGADADLVNLRLGMALARQGDKAGAKAALETVRGTRAETAKFWLIYVATLA